MPQSHRAVLRGFVERADGDLDNAIMLAGEWWGQGLRSNPRPFLDSLEQEFEVSTSPSHEVRQAVTDVFYAAGREEEGFEARLRAQIDPRENPTFAKRVDKELMLPFRRAIIGVLMEEADQYWATREGEDT
jgi:hypothetical protein